MQQSDFERFREIMAGMAKVYERELDGPLLDAYWLALRDWNLADFETGAAHLMQTSEFMPRPAAFTALRRSSEPTAGEAWELALHGQAEPGSRADRAAQIVSNGRRLAMLDIERELPHVQRRFFQVYDELSDVDEARVALPGFDQRKRLRHNGGFRPLGQILPGDDE